MSDFFSGTGAFITSPGRQDRCRRRRLVKTPMITPTASLRRQAGTNGGRSGRLDGHCRSDAAKSGASDGGHTRGTGSRRHRMRPQSWNTSDGVRMRG
jgi:hypothetical protein